MNRFGVRARTLGTPEASVFRGKGGVPSPLFSRAATSFRGQSGASWASPRSLNFNLCFARCLSKESQRKLIPNALSRALIRCAGFRDNVHRG